MTPVYRISKVPDIGQLVDTEHDLFKLVRDE